MKPISMKPLWTLAILGALSATAQAQVTIIDENFDAGLSAGAALSGYAFGDSTSQVRGIVAGIGTGGTPGLQLVNNTAANGNGFAGAAVQLQEMTVSGNSSLNLSDYVLSFDVNATAGSLNLQIQSWSGQFFGGAMSGTLNTAPVPPGFGNDLGLTPSFQHYSLNLGNTTVFPSPSTFLPTGATWQIAFQLNGGGDGIPSQLTINIDNVMVTMVPEPSSLALCALAAAGLGLVRRRKA
jgi:PEP-CTERM motif-containing protein